MQNKQIESRLGRDYDVVKGLLEDICLRGYRTKEYYNRIGIENKTFDYHLRWIKSMLGEQNVVCERKNNGKIIFFRNKPLELQNNPLAEVFRHSVPNRDDFFFLFVILQFFNMPNVKKATVTDICYYIEESYSKKADRALVEQVRRRLEELEWSKIVRKIESRTEENQIEYELRPVIWKEFTYDELQNYMNI